MIRANKFIKIVTIKFNFWYNNGNTISFYNNQISFTFLKKNKKQ